jgi:asparagine synthase (glutamine-hydrolysing)
MSEKLVWSFYGAFNMCGILGQIRFKDVPNDVNLFQEGLKLMRHRGPDDYGVYQRDFFTYGHQRLSIMDLDPRSKQPMLSPNKDIVLVFNGEIYNFRDIKKDLEQKGHSFRTEGDTEVLLHTYMEYGIEGIQKCNGMFAASIYDHSKRTHYLIRDRMGIKPLYYHQTQSQLLFSSEVKSILHLAPYLNKVNLGAVSSYFSFRYPILHDSFFEDIQSLPAGHYLEIHENGTSCLKEYYNISHLYSASHKDLGEEYYKETLAELLEDAVKQRMIADVPLGTYLSGGVDSSILTKYVHSLSSSPTRSYIIGFENEKYNEFSYANLLTQNTDIQHREILLSPDDYMNSMEKLIQLKDAPLSVPNEIPLYLMSQELKKDITVVLSGEGADELFAGYGRIFRSPYDFSRMQNKHSFFSNSEEWTLFQNAFQAKYGQDSFASEVEHFMNIYSYTSYANKRNLIHSDHELSGVENKFKEHVHTLFSQVPTEDYFQKVSYTFLKLHLPGLLNRLDITTMGHSVEARVPFLDHRLVEFAATIPEHYKLKWNSEEHKKKANALMSDQISEVYDTPKYILKESHKNFVPHDILYRKKVGFPVPLEVIFGKNFKEQIKAELLDSHSSTRDLYNRDAIESYFKKSDLHTNFQMCMTLWMMTNVKKFIHSYNLNL